MSEQPANHSRWAARAGMLGPALFTAVFTIEGWARQGYHPRDMYVSALSLGARGGIQIANFVVFGLLLFTFSRGVAAEFREGIASRAGPTMLALIAMGVLLSGPFVMDPDGTLPAQMTAHGVLHSFFGVVVFTLMPVSCFVFQRRFRVEPAWQAFRVWTLIAGTVIAIAIVLLKIAQRLAMDAPSNVHEPVGLLQRVALVTFLVWLFAFAFRMFRKIAQTP